MKKILIIIGISMVLILSGCVSNLKSFDTLPQKIEDIGTCGLDSSFLGEFREGTPEEYIICDSFMNINSNTIVTTYPSIPIGPDNCRRFNDAFLQTKMNFQYGYLDLFSGALVTIEIRDKRYKFYVPCAPKVSDGRPNFIIECNSYMCGYRIDLSSSLGKKSIISTRKNIFK